jgi:hypothetical protein
MPTTAYGPCLHLGSWSGFRWMQMCDEGATKVVILFPLTPRRSHPSRRGCRDIRIAVIRITSIPFSFYRGEGGEAHSAERDATCDVCKFEMNARDGPAKATLLLVTQAPTAPILFMLPPTTEVTCDSEGSGQSRRRSTNKLTERTDRQKLTTLR